MIIVYLHIFFHSVFLFIVSFCWFYCKDVMMFLGGFIFAFLETIGYYIWTKYCYGLITKITVLCKFVVTKAKLSISGSTNFHNHIACNCLVKFFSFFLIQWILFLFLYPMNSLARDLSRALKTQMLNIIFHFFC